MSRPAPRLSVMVITPETYRNVRRTILHLGRQTIRERIELVLVAPAGRELAIVDDEVACFHSVRIVEVDGILRVASAKLAGIRAASAPVVACGEEHCYPEPTWAEIIADRHEAGWAAVGPAMRNANPGTALSWAAMFMHYGCCITPAAAGRSCSLPWHNTAYDRGALLDIGDPLEMLLVAEAFLFDELEARGYRLYFEPAAATSHLNISLARSWFAHAFLGGRLFGATRMRAKRWSAWRRLLYALGGPLIPPMRLVSTVKTIRRLGRADLLAKVLPAVVPGLIVHAAGECLGYALGAGDAERRYAEYELFRSRHVTSEDRAALELTSPSA